MAEFHSVKQGEHVPGIAAKHGFVKYSTVWDHASNAELKRTRQNPNVLYPGDQVYVPDPDSTVYIRPTDQEHKFVLSGEPLELLLVLENVDRQPVPNRACQLRVGLDSFSLTTNGSGLIRHGIKKSAVEASLTFEDSLAYKGKKVPVERHFDLKVGYLDPEDTDTGQLARLANLGYYRGALSPVDADELRSAVEEFQCDNGLTVDGICGPHTQAKLKAVHGS